MGVSGLTVSKSPYNLMSWTRVLQRVVKGYYQGSAKLVGFAGTVSGFLGLTVSNLGFRVLGLLGFRVLWLRGFHA